MVKFISVLLLIGKCWPLLTEMWNFTKLIFASYSRRCQSQWRQSRIEWVKWKCRDSYLVRVEHVVHLFKGIHDMFERLVHETTGYNGAVFDYFLRDLTYFQKGEKQVLVSHDPLYPLKITLTSVDHWFQSWPRTLLTTQASECHPIPISPRILWPSIYWPRPSNLVKSSLLDRIHIPVTNLIGLLSRSHLFVDSVSKWLYERLANQLHFGAERFDCSARATVPAIRNATPSK